jgi:hypothetical protein
MSTGRKGSLLTRLQIAGIVLALLGALGVLLATAFSREVPFLVPAGRAQWIQAPCPVERSAYFFDRRRIPAAIFQRHFTIDEIPPDALLRLQAWRKVKISLNGKELRPPTVTTDLPGRIVEVPLAGKLVRGRNSLRIRVVNPGGPPLLAAELAGLSPPVATDPEWTVLLADRSSRNAVIADDTRAPPPSPEVATPLEGLCRQKIPLLCFFLVGGFACWAWRRRSRKGTGRKTLLAVPLCVSGVWLALFIHIQQRVPIGIGPDAVWHKEYVQLIVQHGALPAPVESWLTYHPPLFYVLEALLLGLVSPEPGGIGEGLLLRTIPFLSCLGILWVTWQLARLVFGGRSRKILYAVYFAAVAPINWLMAAYLSNEALHSFLANLAILLTVWFLAGKGVRPLQILALSLVLGLAILTKVTSLLLLPVIALALVLSIALGAARPLRQAAGYTALLIGGVALVAGWFFVRNWRLYDRWLLWNYDLPGGRGFWQQPGFHTTDYFLGFGAALREPFAAFFHSFGDGVYSTFWGDGFTGGIGQIAEWAKLWNTDAMTAVYLLALPLTVLLIVGWVLLLRAAFREGDLKPRLIFTLLALAIFCVGFAILQHSLAVPYYSVVKANFGMAVFAALAMAAAAGVDWIVIRIERTKSELLFALFHGWLAALAGAVILTWIG